MRAFVWLRKCSDPFGSCAVACDRDHWEIRRGSIGIPVTRTRLQRGRAVIGRIRSRDVQVDLALTYRIRRCRYLSKSDTFLGSVNCRVMSLIIENIGE